MDDRTDDRQARTAAPLPRPAGIDPAVLDAAAPVPSRGVGLSGKLLILTTLFILIAEVLIYVPAVANFRNSWLDDRLAAGRTAALVLEAAPSGMVPEALVRELLDSTGAKAVALKTGPARRLLAASDELPEVGVTFDMRNQPIFRSIPEAFATLFAEDGRTMRVMGEARRAGDFVEIVMDETPLRRALLAFSKTLLIYSLFISVLSAALVYVTLHLMFVRPMRRLTNTMIAFRENPEDISRAIVPTGRKDEVGVAEYELQSMQHSLHDMLAQRSRLAALGLAVSKINHDLRNLLASAQLFSDRLANVPDPTVQRFAPKMIQALDRAIAFCQSTLSYGRAHEAPPQRRPVELAALAEEVRETMGLGEEARIGFVTAVEEGIVLDADPDHLFRVLLNLARNAHQALESRAPNDPARDHIRIAGRREGAVAVIEVSDTGPGVPERARQHLFEAFQGSTRPGGTGLGLAIAAELVRAHGGTITLAEGTLGATFRITIPDRPIDLASARRAHRKRA
ncbi:HAMP domain-containing sensor histidine kinase [Phreatobacter sp.]|uniref:sensor histidine kinase n=1 Tax=Phreatobacter sp. TaxID=1966341 RepID=UPI0025E42C9C|nr:HAMP domain-containing sensor histidine kinase [Phreatobacter sp.]